MTRALKVEGGEEQVWACSAAGGLNGGGLLLEIEHAFTAVALGEN